MWIERANVFGAGAVVVMVVLACKKGNVDGEYAAVLGVEPSGTCAIEGYLRGDAPSASSFPLVVYLSWFDEKGEGHGGIYPTTATDCRFRVAALPCTYPLTYSISARTDSPPRGARLYSSVLGNSPTLAASSGARLTNVRLDFASGWNFHGTAKDASGTPLDGVEVSASYWSSAREGWSRPHEFSRTNASGEWTLNGVE